MSVICIAVERPRGQSATDDTFPSNMQLETDIMSV